MAVTGTGKVEAIHTHPMSIATSTVVEHIFSCGRLLLSHGVFPDTGTGSRKIPMDYLCQSLAGTNVNTGLGEPAAGYENGHDHYY